MHTNTFHNFPALAFLAWLFLFSASPGAWAASKPADPHAGHDASASAPAPAPAVAPAVIPDVGPPKVAITPAARKALGLVVVTAEKKHLKKSIWIVGRVEMDEGRVVAVNAKVEGYVERLNASREGMRVREGEELCALYSQEVYATRQELAMLQKAKKQACTGGEVQGLLEKDAEALLRAGQQRLKLFDAAGQFDARDGRRLLLRSPIDGYVLKKNVTLGMRVGMGDPLFEITDLSTVWVTADLAEADMPLVAVGQPAIIRLRAVLGKSFKANLDYIYPFLSAETRTARLRFVLPNPDLELRPQMFAEIEMRIDLGERLVLPLDAVLDTGTRRLVYVEEAPGSFSLREVSLGVRGEDVIEIAQGLRPGEIVAASAAFLIDSETRLRGGGGGHQH